MQREEIYEEYGEPQSFWSKMRERMFGPEDEMEDEVETALPTPSRPAIRLHSSRTVHVDIRISPANLEDGRTSADGLKAGKQQLVNLERTPPRIADRLVDFLSGVTYALDGTVERIGDRVYLFAPANVQIEIEGSTEADAAPESAWAD